MAPLTFNRSTSSSAHTNAARTSEALANKSSKASTQQGATAYQKDSFSKSASSATSSSNKEMTPLQTALYHMMATSQNSANKTQAQKLTDGSMVVFENSGGKAQFAIFNKDGSPQQPAAGYQAVDTSNNGKMNVSLKNGQVLQLSARGFTVSGKATAASSTTTRGASSNSTYKPRTTTSQTQASSSHTNQSTRSGSSSAQASVSSRTGQSSGTGNHLSSHDSASTSALPAEFTDANFDLDLSGVPMLKDYELRKCEVQLYPSGNPTSSDIHQGVLGDCYFDAALASLASTSKGQQMIKNMIKPGAAEGTYDVTMHAPNGSKVKISVDSDFLVSKTTGHINSSHEGLTTANWGSILESAWGKYNDVYHTFSSGTGFAGISAGSGSSYAKSWDTSFTFALTGSKGEGNKRIDTMSKQELGTWLARRLGSAGNASGAGVTATVPANSPDLADGVSLIRDHVYSVLAYDPASQTVTVRNPWGKGLQGRNSDGSNELGDGTIKLSLDDFAKAFKMTNSWTSVTN